MKVVLIGMYPTEAFGIAPLIIKATALGHAGISDLCVDVKFFQAPCGNYDVEEICSQVSAFTPDVIGVGCYLWNRPDVIRLIAALKAQMPRALVVVGGPEAETTESAETLLKLADIDVVIRGEGEFIFAELLSRYQKTKLQGVLNYYPPPGITYRTANGQFAHSPDPTPIEPLDLIPTPFNHELADFNNLQRIPSFETYRGCTMKCKYCNWGKARGMRFFSLDRVKRDLDFILSLNIERIWFVDAVFNLQGSDRYKEILRYLAVHNRSGIQYTFEMMAELLDDEGIDLISEFPAGSSIAFGLQSTDKIVLRKASRPHNWKKFSRVIRRIRQEAPQVEVCIDLIYGLPGDRAEKFKRSLLAAVDLDPIMIQVHPFRVLVGTEFYDERALHGFRDVGTGSHVITLDRGIPEEECYDYRWYSYWVNVYHSPRHRGVIQDIHEKTEVNRSVLLEAFMSHYENIIGRAYFDDLDDAAKEIWRRDIREVHRVLRAQYQV